ncbi:iron complex transport system ATP-binding protein [Ruminiclostridium sufflavum DSM 19573]|uniref:Iron complex transport system ATP-binding protein n=1 Tax=Ruminiclostridium sufflavum DSM 19573 TaxID=1121337 RepID=A0A318XJY6_9FIRM|nr:ABC transporter ATP-binding protein [Ruminiclostridium sufflavum]PYG84856.1 iron complex transport system ATP-binding protein [Ruminiclostridium sufflavum DSM 19573]
MLDLKNLSGGYSGSNIVQDVSLCFPEGKITVIIGQNGCGKSTLLKLACGQLAKRAGELLLDKQSLAALSRQEIAQKISYLPQARTMPDITVEALVLHGRFPWLGYPRVYTVKDRKLAESAMERAGIISHRKKLFAKLSGGEQQKAYLAMLLAQDTKTVLLDEPTTYLDIEHQLELIELLSALKSDGRAIAAVLHDLNLALSCADQLAVMQAGSLLAVGTPRNILDLGILEQAFGIKVRLEQSYSFERL